MQLETGAGTVEVKRYKKDVYTQFFAILKFQDDETTEGFSTVLERELNINYDARSRSDLTKDVLEQAAQDMVEKVQEERGDIEVTGFKVEERQPAIVEGDG